MRKGGQAHMVDAGNTDTPDGCTSKYFILSVGTPEQSPIFGTTPVMHDILCRLCNGLIMVTHL